MKTADLRINRNNFPLVYSGRGLLLPDRITSEITALKNELKGIRGGVLHLAFQDGKCFFREYKNGVTKRLTRDPERVYKLARKMFIKLRLELLEAENPEPVKEKMDYLLDRFIRAGLNIDRIIMTPEQYAWSRDGQSRNYSNRKNLTRPSPAGIIVRSKSEQQLAAVIERLHLPYRYEPEVIINGIFIHPDFVIMLPDSSLIIIEHFGMTLNSDTYLTEALERLRNYETEGIQLGISVFCTFEFNTTSEQTLKEIITNIVTRASGCSIYINPKI